MGHRARLVRLLQRAYSGELAAAYAYRGHWRALRDAEESRRVKQIEEEEWRHREVVGGMLQVLTARPNPLREIQGRLIGRVLGPLCHVAGWLLPMYAAGWLEHSNVVEYEQGARLAGACGHSELVGGLQAMARVERDHERYFRSRVERDPLGRHLPLWPAPAASGEGGGACGTPRLRELTRP